MPEGHTVHRLARRHLRAFADRPLHVDSPQGRFAAGAALLDGLAMTGSQAHGKHLFLGFGRTPADGRAGPRRRAAQAAQAAHAARWLHVHLGLYGEWRFGTGEPPEPRGAVRVRLVADDAWAELRGPTACEVIDAGGVEMIRARLGADPLRRDADPDAAGVRIARSRAPIGALLMQQEVVAGVGNVYRAEALFRARVDPWTPGRTLPGQVWPALWTDLVALMRDGVKRGRIVTTSPTDRSRPGGAVRREDAHYVYRRAGLPCRICGTAVVTEVMAGRKLYRCPVCQTAA